MQCFVRPYKCDFIALDAYSLSLVVVGIYRNNASISKGNVKIRMIRAHFFLLCKSVLTCKVSKFPVAVLFAAHHILIMNYISNII